MIGTEKISLIPVNLRYRRAYNQIWKTINRSEDRDLLFGSTTGSGKGLLESVGAEKLEGGELPLLFLLIGVFLVLDAIMDPNSWNELNISFFFILMLLVAAGIFWPQVELRFGPRSWRHYRFLVRIGEWENIGVGDIYHDRHNSVCLIAVALLPEHRRQKLGSVASRLLLRKCFSELHVNRVESSAVSTNIASLRMRDGMIEEGVLKQKRIIRERSQDEHLYRLLKSEWEQQIAQREKH